MHKPMVVAVALFAVGLVCFTAGAMWSGGLAVQAEEAGDAASTPSGNGDVNGDGTLDLSDAVGLLHFLFQGGPAPVPIAISECPPCDSCCPSVHPLRLPATGRRSATDDAGAEIDCARADFPGQDGSYQAGCPNEGRFTDNLDGTVTDNCTGLMWQTERAPETCNWQQALQYCDGLILAGHSDWRLPNVRELQSIVDVGRFLPAIDPVFGARTENFWSSTTNNATNPEDAWLIGFGDGNTNNNQNKAMSYSVRAVRNVQ